MKKKLSVLIIILSLLMGVSGCTNKSITNPVLKNNESIKYSSTYLEKYALAINLEDDNDYSTFKCLDQATLNDEIFLIGENHQIKDNYKVKTKFLKYFKEKTNFKYLLIEDSYISSIYYNKYLETGNEIYLNKNFLPSNDAYEFWKNLYAYNLKLNINDKIKIIGIDISNNKQYLEYILKMLTNKILDSDMKQDVVFLKNYLKLISNFGNNMNNLNEQ